jgi:hypothetical protein
MKTHANFTPTSRKNRVVAALSAVCVSIVVFAAIGTGFNSAATVEPHAMNVIADKADTNVIVVTAKRLS